MEIKKAIKRGIFALGISGFVGTWLYCDYMSVKNKQKELRLAEYNGINEGKRVGIHDASPAILYTADLNGDGKADYVVVSNDSEYQTIFLQQEDGTYKRLDEVGAEEQAKALSPIKERIKSIEEKAANLEKKVKESK